jgi:hypothetical protein
VITQNEYIEWSNSLADLIPEDDVSEFSNPEAAQEAIIHDCLKAYVAERAELIALVTRWEALQKGDSSVTKQVRQALGGRAGG